MATSPLFGWEEPDDTDLVKDGAAAIRTLGNAIDTSMGDLLGGTSGQILSKASNTNMDFTWITNDVGDITAVTAGTGISGGGTSGAVTITNSMATAIDAKGDLIAGTGADAFSRIAAGANGTTLVADSTAATGLKWAASPNFVGCSVHNSTAQSITNNTLTALSFDTDGIDTDGFHPTGAGNARITIPAGLGGKYLINAAMRFGLSATGKRTMALFVNGGQVVDIAEEVANNSQFLIISKSFILSLNAGDYLELGVFQSSGGNLDCYARALEAPFSVQYLGA
jgi:hypothetical protein